MRLAYWIYILVHLKANTHSASASEAEAEAEVEAEVEADTHTADTKMPKGKGKSKGATKCGPPPRQMSYCDTDPSARQYYARLTKIYGHGQAQVTYYGKSVEKDSSNDPSSNRLREIRANVRQRRGLKKLKVLNGNYIIISLREFEVGAADVLHVYRDDEVKLLRRRHEIPAELERGTRDEDEDSFFSEHAEEAREENVWKNDRVDQYGIPIEDEEFTNSDSDTE